MGWLYWLSSKKYNIKCGKISNLYWRNLTNTTSSRCSRLISTILNNVKSLYPWYDVMRIILYGPFPTTNNPSINMRKILDNPNWGTVHKSTWLVHLTTIKIFNKQDWQIVTNRKSLRRETWLINIIWYPIWDPRREKRH